MIELVPPSERYRQSYLEAEAEYAAAGELGSALPFDEHLARLAAQDALVELWLVERDEYLGKLHVRRAPEAHQGHLGVKVRPSRRREGLARKMLELAQPLLPPQVEATCDPANAASIALVVKLGGERMDDVVAPDGSTMSRFSFSTIIRPPV